MTPVMSSASEYINSDVYRDVQSTAVMYMLSKDKTITNLVEYSIRLEEKRKDNLNMRNSIESILKQLVNSTKKNKYNNILSTSDGYVKVQTAAEYLDVDESFLNKRKGGVFKLGIHFFKPNGQAIVRWDTKALKSWITAEDNNHLIDDEVAELLERS